MNHYYIKGFILVISILLLAGCNAPLKTALISENYHLLRVYKEDAIVYETKDSDEIKKIIHKINTSRRDTTETWELPEPIGKMIFINDKEEEVVLSLFEGGHVAFRGFYVYSGFNF
ncbi:hypothetical protein WAK64_16250 [Bacillus spongiae]|uniref:Lipoprotein n=1 Tax=Bacillus spongiae TaxID=2683610 RepID=A0ABU8HH58_9BACI